MNVITIFSAALTVLATTAFNSAGAAINAQDQADDAAYTSGWTVGTKGGSGLGSWQMALNGGTATITDSTALAAGNSGADINTTDKSFKLYNDTDYAHAWRSFDTELPVGSTFSISVAVNGNASGFNKGLNVTSIGANSQTVPFFNFRFAGDGTYYSQYDSIAFSNGASANTCFDFTFTQVTETNCNYQVVRSGDFSETIRGSFEGRVGGLKVYGKMGGTDPEDAIFFNSLKIETPEPPPVYLEVGRDDADEAAYDSGWNSGSNGGEGFQGWSMDLNGGTATIADSRSLASDNSGADINTDGKSFKFYNSGAYAHAWRSFGSELDVGGSFSITVAVNGYQTSYNKGLNVASIGASSGTDPFFNFRFAGSSGKYYSQYDNNAFTHGSASNTRFDFTFTQDTETECSYRIVRSGTYSETISGTFTGRAGSLKIYGKMGGTDPEDAIFFNNLQIQSGPIEARSFYVATDGDDSSDGYLTTPLATIQEAANQAGPGDTVYIRGGTYRETVTVPASGTEEMPIIFAAYGSEKPIISACDSVTNWTQHSGNIWKAPVSWDMGSDGVGNTLFMGGVLKFEARQGAENDPLDLNNWGYIAKGDMQSSYFEADDIKGWGDDYWNGAKLHVHLNDWTIRQTTVSDYDSSSGRISFPDLGGISQKHQFGYYLYDTINALDEEGEWFKNRSTDLLYYQVAAGQDPNTLDIEFKRREFAFNLDGRDHIHINGLIFRGTSIDQDSESDYNLISGNTFYANNKGGLSSMWLKGKYNTFRDNTVKQTWRSVITLSGYRNSVINNYFYDIGYDGTTRVMGMTGSEHLVANNTVRNFARSFLDGFPYSSEFAYNIFEDGGNLSWDTGVFDGDSGRGNGGGCIVHHNLFRDSNPIGIYMSFYAGLDLVVHHNIVYNISPLSFRIGQLQFAKYYHNTIIGAGPRGDTDASGYAFQSAYNNNLQSTLDDCASLGVDYRNNIDYQSSDFVDFNSNDFRLAAGSAAIDAGLVLPGINDGYTGSAPDAGALEYGEDLWQVGHDFSNPPAPEYSWTNLPGSNLYTNNLFSLSLDDNWVFTGSPVRFYGNAWNTGNTGLSRSGGFAMQLQPGDGMRRVFNGLKPETWYSVGIETRLVDQCIEAEQYDDTSATLTSDDHRYEDYITGLADGEWVRYDGIDFGSDSKYNAMELSYSRPSGTANVATNARLDVRIDSPTGAIIGTFSYLDSVNDAWYATQIDLPAISGRHDLYFSGNGSDAATMWLATARLLHENPKPEHRITMGAQNYGGPRVSTRAGKPYWIWTYERFKFKTGPSSDSAEIFLQNDGIYDAYVDRLCIFEEQDIRSDAASGQATELSSTYPGSDPAFAVDGDPATMAQSSDLNDSWWHVDLGTVQKLQGIKLTAPQTVPGELSNFRVSVWNNRPTYGSEPLWRQDYLSNNTLASGETLIIKNSDEPLDSGSALGTVEGRYVKVQLLSDNALGNGRLGLAELQVLAYDTANYVLSDGTISSTASSWQCLFPAKLTMGQIEITNQSDASWQEQSNFKVTVWDESGGNIVWQQTYTDTIPQGGTLIIDADAISTDGFTRLSSCYAQIVLIENNGNNLAGNNDFSPANVAILDAVTAPPLTNVALAGIPSLSSTNYTDHGYAEEGNDAIIAPLGNRAIPIRASDAWWEVELTEDVTIDQIVFWGCESQGDFKILVYDSSHTQRWTKDYNGSTADLKGLTINGNTWSSTTGNYLSSFSNARYVRVQMREYNLFAVSELQVWAPGSPRPEEKHNLRVEAEDYDAGGEAVAYHDTTTGNTGGAYRDDDVDIAILDDGKVVGWAADGEWLTYTIQLAPGTYALTARLASPSGDSTLTASLAGQNIAVLTAPATGSWSVFSDVTSSNIVVSSANPQLLRLDLQSGYNLNWVEFELVGADADADTLRDDWEQTSFGNLTYTADQDPDRDGFDNGEEYMANTLGFDSNSFFHLEQIFTPAGLPSIQWTAQPERQYDVFRADTITGRFIPLQRDLTTGTYIDTDDQPQAFYRIEAHLPE